MNTKRIIIVIIFGLGLILALLWLTYALADQAQAQEGSNPTRSKLDANIDRSQNSSVAGDLSSASVGNDGFENGPDGTWTEYSAWGYPLIVSATTLMPITPHGGEWAVWLGGVDDEISVISQTVTITTGESTLSYWMWVDSEDTCGFDFGQIIIDNTEVYSISLCIDANTNGWVNSTLDLSAYIGQDVDLQFRAETDDIFLSNLYIDDVTLLGPLTYIYLPCINKNDCGFYYFDDFSNPASGWVSGDDTERTYGYLSGEYQILLKNPDSRYLITPDLVLPSNYRIEVDAYQPSTAKDSHGIAFGTRFNAGTYETYHFLVYPPSQEFLLEKKYLNDTWSILIDWTYRPEIHSNTSNHLRVDRVGSLIRLYINGVQVSTITDASFVSAGRDAGLRVYSGDDAPVDTHFDNFRATCLP